MFCLLLATPSPLAQRSGLYAQPYIPPKAHPGPLPLASLSGLTNRFNSPLLLPVVIFSLPRPFPCPVSENRTLCTALQPSQSAPRRYTLCSTLTLDQPLHPSSFCLLLTTPLPLSQGAGHPAKPDLPPGAHPDPAPLQHSQVCSHPPCTPLSPSPPSPSLRERDIVHSLTSLPERTQARLQTLMRVTEKATSVVSPAVDSDDFYKASHMQSIFYVRRGQREGQRE